MTITATSQSVFNGYTSIMRNMYLTASIGMATMAFSNRFPRYKKFVKLLALSIFIYSIFYGLKANRDFKQYLDLLETQKDLSDLNRLQLKHWREWTYFSNFFMGILIVISFIIFYKKIF